MVFRFRHWRFLSATVLGQRLFLQDGEDISDMRMFPLDPTAVAPFKAKLVTLRIGLTEEGCLQVLVEDDAGCSGPRPWGVSFIGWQQSLDEPFIHDDLGPVARSQRLARLLGREAKYAPQL